MYLSLVVLDIVDYAQKVQRGGDEPFHMHAQMHVSAVAQTIIPGAELFWIKNDHALMILKDSSEEQVLSAAQRITRAVRVPFRVPGAGERWIMIGVSAAIRVLTYRDLSDIGRDRGAQPRRSLIGAIIDDIRAHTHKERADSILRYTADGWERL